jgi:hypothetical protein
MTQIATRPLGGFTMKAAIIALCCLVGITALGSLVAPPPSSAAVCERTVNKHCYALVENHATFEGTWVDLLTSAAEVYDWKEGSFLDNEQWTSVEGGGWVEDGDEVSDINGSEGKYLRYFYAKEYPLGFEHYYVYNFSTGPKMEEWFYVQEQDEGNGTWCAFINGGEVYCIAGLPLYSPKQESGIEAAANVQPYNYGTTYGWGMELGTGDWREWSHRTYYNANGLGEYDKYCVFPVEASSWEKGAAFATPNNNPSCLPDQEDLVNGNAGSSEPPTPPGVPGASEQAHPATVEANYTIPSGSVLSNTQLRSAINTIAKNAGDTETPSRVEVVEGSLRNSIETIDPTNILPSNPTAGYASWLGSPTYLLVLHGNFVLSNEPIPPGAATPSGTVLDVIVDAHTGEVDGLHVADQTPAGLANVKIIN